jgi:hypothetical protein
MADQEVPIVPIVATGWEGTSPDGTSVTFGFKAANGRVFRFACGTGGLEDALNSLVGLYDRANEKRGVKTSATGDSAAARMHLSLDVGVGLMEPEGLPVLNVRTAANTTMSFVLSGDGLRELGKQIAETIGRLESTGGSWKDG